MSNVINFQEKLRMRQMFETRREELSDFLSKKTNVYIDYYRTFSKTLATDDLNPTMALAYACVVEGMSLESNEVGMQTFGSSLQPDINVFDKKDSRIINCLRLSNGYGTPDTPQGSLTGFALGTADGFKELFNYDVNRKLSNSTAFEIKDKQEVLHIIFDYGHSHPDVNSVRDNSTMSVLGYASAKKLVEDAGYTLTKMCYDVVQQGQNRIGMPTELVLEFSQTNNDKLAKNLYLYLDVEVIFTSVEAMFYDLYGVDSKELKEIVSKKDDRP